MADRLELPLIDQLAARPADKDGAWVYPSTVGGREAALVAWWFDGTLQSIGLINASHGTDRARAVADQFGQMAWAGDLEGWLKGVPGVFLVAGPEIAADWEPLLRQATGQRVDVIVPPEPVQLALATVCRAAKAAPRSGLLPEDYSLRYHQQFVDRIWMRSLGAVIVLYCIVVAVYLSIAGVQSFRAGRVEDQVKAHSGTYTNALQMRARVLVLKERQDLKFAALDCWKATAELLPEGVTLQGLDFRDGKKLLLTGIAPADAASALMDFNEKLRKVEINGQTLFTKFDVPSIKKNQAGGELSWSFSCELNRKDDK
jgi:Tfp pilus assembly protein PilN